MDNIKDLQLLLEQHIEQVRDWQSSSSVLFCLSDVHKITSFLFQSVLFFTVWDWWVGMHSAHNICHPVPIYWKVCGDFQIPLLNKMWSQKGLIVKEPPWHVLPFFLWRLREDMDVPTTTLIGAHGYCTQVWCKSNGLGGGLGIVIVCLLRLRCYQSFSMVVSKLCYLSNTCKQLSLKN